jgi:methyl-accepting chemotaxis protein
MKTRDELIEAMEITRKELVKQVNKSKEEIQRKAKILYNQLQQEQFRMTRRDMRFKPSEEDIKKKKKEAMNKIVTTLKPQVCTSLLIKSYRVTSITNTKKQPVYIVRMNPVIEQPVYEKISKGLLFKNVKWLPTIDLGNTKRIKAYEKLTYMTSLKESERITYESKRKYVKYQCESIITIANVREFKFIPKDDKVKEKEDYIELLNRRIKGARQLNNHYQTMYEDAVCGIKLLKDLQHENDLMTQKVNNKKQLLNALNTKTTETIKNNRAKIHKIKKEVEDIKKKKKKNIDKYRESKKLVEEARRKNKYYENRHQQIAEENERINNKVKAAVNQIKAEKRKAYRQIRNAGINECVDVNFNGIGDGIGSGIDEY